LGYGHDRTGPHVTPRAERLDGQARVAPFGRRAWPDARPRGRSRGAHVGQTRAAPRAPSPPPRAGSIRTPPWRTSSPSRRKLARHRGAVFMGPAALPRWPLAVLSGSFPGVGESVAPRPDNAAYAKLRSSSAGLALLVLPCACGRASRTHPMARKARAGRSFKHCRH